jgi:hypothetical protein
LISGLIVEGERLKCLSIERMDNSAKMFLEISSHSDKGKTSLDRLRMGGRIPPVEANLLKIKKDGYQIVGRLSLEVSLFPSDPISLVLCSSIFNLVSVGYLQYRIFLFEDYSVASTN